MTRKQFWATVVAVFIGCSINGIVDSWIERALDLLEVMLCQ